MLNLLIVELFSSVLSYFLLQILGVYAVLLVALAKLASLVNVIVMVLIAFQALRYAKFANIVAQNWERVRSILLSNEIVPKDMIQPINIQYESLPDSAPPIKWVEFYFQTASNKARHTDI